MEKITYLPNGQWKLEKNKKSKYSKYINNPAWITMYEGDFLQGDYHGYGVYTFPSGRQKKGYWYKGRFVGDKMPEPVMEKAPASQPKAEAKNDAQPAEE